MIFIKYHKHTSFFVKAISGLLVFVSILSAIDIYSDIQHHVAWSHILIEITIILCSLLSSILLMHWFYKISKSTINQFKSDMTNANNEMEFWKYEHRQMVRGLAIKIDQQFKYWGLTPTETTVGFLLLKGFSLKEIAKLRSTSESTVREQAGNIYHKSNLSGRAELTAFFLEDLLLPNE